MKSKHRFNYQLLLIPLIIILVIVLAAIGAENGIECPELFESFSKDNKKKISLDHEAGFPGRKALVASKDNPILHSGSAESYIQGYNPHPYIMALRPARYYSYYSGLF